MKKNLFYTLSALFISVSLVSCGGDDDTTGGGTSQSTGVHNGHQWVDLGLSVKWATCNVGASQPWEYGSFYSWGEIETQEIYNTSNNKYHSSELGWTKYCTDSSNGIFDGKGTLELSDDAAYQNWKGTWRTPTKQEVEELYNSCVWRYTTNYDGKGIAGYIVFKAKVSEDKGVKQCDGDYTPTSATYSIDNDAYIFLPFAGHCDPKVDGINPSTGEYQTTEGKYAYYWTSTLRPDGRCAYDLDLHSNKVHIGTTGRGHGETIRAVCPK